MHPNARPYIDAVTDPALRSKLQVFFDAYDSMDRENTHLRLQQQQDGCPYGHASPTAGCRLGYPGCMCMDDLMAMSSWSPEDEDKAVVRLGARLKSTRRALDDLKQAAVGISLSLQAAGFNALARTLQKAVHDAKPKVRA